MKLNGTHKFKASGTQVFNAILDPKILKSAIPGCNAVTFASPEQATVEITTPLPGLHGPFSVDLAITNKQAPSSLKLETHLNGKEGSIDAVCNITIADEADGSLLSYEATADLAGVVAMADNPIGRPIVNASLKSFFNNLEKALEASLV
jgi:hypothetical protein